MGLLACVAVLVVFAGGRSSRFGRDKCTYVHGGRRLIDYVIEAGREVVDKVVIAAGQNAHLYPGEEVVADSPRFSGPLAAVDSAVQLFDETLIFAPCDAPYLRPAAFKELLRAEAPLSVWVFPNGRVESTIFKAEPAAARGALGLLAQHRRSRLDDLFRLVPTEFLAVEKHGADPTWLLNVNKAQDLAGAAPAFKHKVFLDDYLLRWGEPPLARWLTLGDVEALRTEFLRYVEVGLLSMAAHVAKDLGTPSFRALAEIIYEAVDIEKARQG
jgi:molybdopterin-guanine dinucleotide biosynthesis protein A